MNKAGIPLIFRQEGTQLEAAGKGRRFPLLQRLGGALYFQRGKQKETINGVPSFTELYRVSDRKIGTIWFLIDLVVF